MAHQGASATRDEKVVNLMTNYTMLFASMFEDAFADLAAKMAETVAGVGDAMAGAMSEGLSGGAGEGATAGKRTKVIEAEIGPQVSAQVKKMFSGLRKDVSSKMQEDSKEFRTYIANPAFDQGIAIVEKYDFDRPRITERLDDEDLASYLMLLKSGDAALGRMFQELGKWQEGLPKPPFRG
ncbi:MAG: hypothetical protein ABSA72_00040 [Nitrososphaerales archaeon]|jgi:Spy/CpxP family protein refolding chaperone